MKKKELIKEHLIEVFDNTDILEILKTHACLIIESDVSFIQQNESFINRAIFKSFIFRKKNSKYENITNFDITKELILLLVRSFLDLKTNVTSHETLPVNDQEIILNKVEEINFILMNKLNELIKNENSIKQIKDTTIDYSHTKQIDKIIILNELGVIDFLRTKEPFSFCVNKLAEVLSSITGEKTDSLNPYLRALIKEKTESLKHPYRTPKTVQKNKDWLIHKGFNLQ